jgi:hypothetical protein
VHILLTINCESSEIVIAIIPPKKSWAAQPG